MTRSILLAATLLAFGAHAEVEPRLHQEAPIQQDAAQTAPAAVIETEPEPAPEAKEVGRGLASWYGPRFHGKRTASGERFDMHALTAAHRSLPFGTIIEVHSLVNGRKVEVRVNDRGPFLRKRVIDLSRAAANALGLIESGSGTKPVILKIRPPAKAD